MTYRPRPPTQIPYDLRYHRPLDIYPWHDLHRVVTELALRHDRRFALGHRRRISGCMVNVYARRLSLGSYLSKAYLSTPRNSEALALSVSAVGRLFRPNLTTFFDPD